jgi:ubiquinone/menaquinone biosynthesis C-methylase UbiE
VTAHPTSLPRDLGPLRTQDTLEPLVADGDRVATASGARSYPFREGLIFMGYSARDEKLIKETMEEERKWQGTPQRVHLDEEFLRTSAPRAVDLVRLLERMTGKRAGLKALELGSGSGWVSWLLDRGGFDTWMVDFEPNSLYSGWLYDSETLGPGRRIVADARYAPFADESFDLVLLKEFAHHVEDSQRLFAEVNRVLKQGGLLALLEPTKSVWLTLYGLRHPDPHAGHSLKFLDHYLLQLHKQGFRRRHLSFAYHGEPRRAIIRKLQERAARNVEGMRHNRSVFTALQVRLLGGGQMVYVGEKARSVAPPARPEFRQIETSRLILTPQDRDAWRGCAALVERAAERLL